MNYNLAAIRKETANKLNKMKRQRNMQKMKEHDKNPQDQVNEEEVGSILEKDDPKSLK